MDDLNKTAKTEAAKVGSFDLDGNFTTTTSSVLVPKAVYEKALTANDDYKTKKAAIEAEYTRVITAINTAAGKTGFVGFEKGISTNNADYPGFDYKASGSFEYQFNAPTALSSLTNFADEAAVAAFKQLKSDALNDISAIVLEGVYSKDYNGQTTSNYDKASALISKATEAINEVALASDDESGAAAGIAKIKSVYTAPAGKAKASGALYTGGPVTIKAANDYDFGTGLNGITKIADQEDITADLTYAQNKVLSDMLTSINSNKAAVTNYYYSKIRAEKAEDKPNITDIAKWTQEMREAEELCDAATEVVTYLVKHTDEISDLGSFGANGFTTTPMAWLVSSFNPAPSAVKDLTALKALKIYAQEYQGGVAPALHQLTFADCKTITDEVDKAEKMAANDKVYINLDGSYAVQIDKALEDAIEQIYIYKKTAADAYKTPTNTTELSARKDELIKTGNVVIDGKKYADSVNDWKAYADKLKNTYEKDQYDEIRAVAAETKTAINAAKTIAEADAAFLAGYAKFDAIPTKQEHKNMFTLKSGALTDKYDKYQEQFKAYVTAKDTALTNLNAKNDYDYTVSDLQDYFAKELAGEFYTSIYTEADLDAKYAEALAVVDKLKTKAEMKAEADAAVTAINALPATATVADKEAVKAARKAYDDYADYAAMIGAANLFTSDGTYVKVLDKLTAAEDAIKKAERKEISDAFKALPAVDKITPADKAAVEAIRSMIDAYVDSYVATDANNITDDGNEKSIQTLYEEAMGGAPNLTKFEGAGGYEDAVKASEVDVVKDMIAKLAVDNIDAAAVRAARAAYDALDDDMKFFGTEYDKLVALEKVLAVDVQALKITASSTAKKGSITVKWKVEGNASSAEAYEIWKSTKKNSGFKKAFTTKDGTKRSYKNTKGLKKGTRYYYKVRAIAYVDGIKVKSDWSNKAYRKAL